MIHSVLRHLNLNDPAKNTLKFDDFVKMVSVANKLMISNYLPPSSPFYINKAILMSTNNKDRKSILKLSRKDYFRPVSNKDGYRYMARIICSFQ